jgi:hypothetical protein
MLSITQIAAILAFTSSVFATPVEKRDAFSVKQVERGLKHKNGESDRWFEPHGMVADSAF